jgi:phage terminase small subunit
MTKKQIAFCRAYIETSSGAKAARIAGYSEKTARQMAWKIIHKSKAQPRIILHAYNVITFPEWPFWINGGFIADREKARAANAEFLKTVKLPGWFITDMKNGRYKKHENH